MRHATPTARRPLAAPLAAAALFLAGCASTPAAAPAEGQAPASAASTDARKRMDEAAQAVFQRAESLRAAGRFEDARDAYRGVREDFPSSPLAGEAQFLEAESAFAAKRYYAAGELYARYAEQRPLSPHVREVEKRMYDIGDWLIEDGRRGLWGLGIFTTSEEGVTLLRRLSTLLPTGDYADDALMRIGRWYAENRDYVGAETALDELLKNYPSSEWRLEARFLLAWTYREDNRGPAYDGEKLRRARANFLAYADKASAEPARAEEYKERIQAARDESAAIDCDLAKKALLRARFYRRSGRPEAALAVLREATRQWGITEAGKDCAAQADDLARELGVGATPEAPAPAAPPAEKSGP